METRGGARMGAGRPKGGISQARRLITAAIHKGLADAGRKKYPSLVSTDPEEAAVQTAAMIVDDMIQAGRGGDVLKLWANVAMKENTDEKGNGKTSLAAALSKLPGAGQVLDVSQIGRSQPEPAEDEGGTTHIERGEPEKMPYFAPQGCLLLDGLDDETGDTVTINQPAD